MMKTGKYSSILADDAHDLITNIKAFKKKWAMFTMGFFLNGKVIGKGDLEKQEKGTVHTDNVLLFKSFRKKGHGIGLYVHLIETARKIGAKRIYSSRTLNNLSGRMWREKLSKLYDVKIVYRRGACHECGGTLHEKPKYYYIELN